MNPEARLTAQHCRSVTDEIAEWIGTDAARFAELVRIMEHGPAKIRPRAGWVVCTCGERYPHLAEAQFSTLLRILQSTPDTAVHRHIMKLFSLVPVPDIHADAVFSAAVGLLSLPEEPVGVKAYAITVLGRMTRSMPELLPEIRALVSEHLPGQTAAYRSRARREFGLGNAV